VASVPLTVVKDEEVKPVIEKTVGQVLGFKTYADGTLLRSKITKRIYVIVNGKLAKIANLKELAKYAGQPIIDVDQNVIDTYNEQVVLGVKVIEYAEGTLLRSKITKRIYVIVNGKLAKIANLKELAKYAGQPIIDVDQNVIDTYNEQIVLKAKVVEYAEGDFFRSKTTGKIYIMVNGKMVLIPSPEVSDKYNGRTILDVEQNVIDSYSYADGTLLRSLTTKRIYVIIDGKKVHIVSLAQLKKYAGKKIVDVTEDVLRNY